MAKYILKHFSQKKKNEKKGKDLKRLHLEQLLGLVGEEHYFKLFIRILVLVLYFSNNILCLGDSWLLEGPLASNILLPLFFFGDIYKENYFSLSHLRFMFNMHTYYSLRLVGMLFKISESILNCTNSYSYCQFVDYSAKMVNLQMYSSSTQQLLLYTFPSTSISFLLGNE